MIDRRNFIKESLMKRQITGDAKKNIKEERKKCFMGNNAPRPADYMLQITMKKKEMSLLL